MASQTRVSDLRNEAPLHRVTRCYADRPPDLFTHFRDVVTRCPNATAVVEGDCRVSYAELYDQAESILEMLKAQGVIAGDRVAVLLTNGVDAVRTIVALLRLGAGLVADGTRSRSAELDYICADCAPAALGMDAGPNQQEEALFAILYTSGTTGKPKGAMLTHLGVIHSCLHWREAFGLVATEVSLVCVPWAHVSGLCGVVMPFLYLGGTLVMLPEFKRRAALELAERENITHALMVPAMCGLCLLEPDLAAFDLKSWRISAYGGAPMPQPTISCFASAFPWLAMCNAYGATETTSPATIMPPGEGTARADSIGKVVRCGEIRVMDEQACEVPAGTDGELWIAGPMVVPGYWRNPKETANSFVSGYWKSGDIGSIDADGYVSIADRKKDMIIRGGFKIYPAEVESILSGLEGVVEAAVVGQTDSMLGEAVVAFVTSHNGGLTAVQVRDWCAHRLSDYKVPAEVIIEAAALSRNANGKIQKAALREPAAALCEQAA